MLFFGEWFSLILTWENPHLQGSWWRSCTKAAMQLQATAVSEAMLGLDITDNIQLMWR